MLKEQKELFKVIPTELDSLKGLLNKMDFDGYSLISFTCIGNNLYAYMCIFKLKSISKTCKELPSWVGYLPGTYGI